MRRENVLLRLLRFGVYRRGKHEASKNFLRFQFQENPYEQTRLL